jgi:hypothetical protein
VQHNQIFKKPTIAQLLNNLDKLQVGKNNIIFEDNKAIVAWVYQEAKDVRSRVSDDSNDDSNVHEPDLGVDEVVALCKQMAKVGMQAHNSHGLEAELSRLALKFGAEVQQTHMKKAKQVLLDDWVKVGLSKPTTGRATGSVTSHRNVTSQM